MDLDPAQFNFVQGATILFALLVLYEQYRIYKIDKKNWKRIGNASIWALHLLIFYIFLLLDSANIVDFHDVFGPTFFTSWSPYLRLHSAMAFYYIVRSSHIITTITQKTENIMSNYTTTSEDTNVK